MSEKEIDANATMALHEDDVSKKDLAEDAVAKPESIRNMSDEELRVLEKKMVRKMDLVIM